MQQRVCHNHLSPFHNPPFDFSALELFHHRRDSAADPKAGNTLVTSITIKHQTEPRSPPPCGNSMPGPSLGSQLCHNCTHPCHQCQLKCMKHSGQNYHQDLSVQEVFACWSALPMASSSSSRVCIPKREAFAAGNRLPHRCSDSPTKIGRRRQKKHQN